MDEAHILHPAWFKALKVALKDPDNGSLLIVNDASQKLRRKRFSWASVGISARGKRTIKYTKNYRNTKETLDFAWKVLTTLADSEPEAEEAFPW